MLEDKAVLSFVCASCARRVRVGRAFRHHLGRQPGQIHGASEGRRHRCQSRCPDARHRVDVRRCRHRWLVVEGSGGGSEGGGFKQPEKVSTLVPLHAIRERVDMPLIAAGAIVAAEVEATGTAPALDRRGSDALNRRHMCSIITF